MWGQPGLLAHWWWLVKCNCKYCWECPVPCSCWQALYSQSSLEKKEREREPSKSLLWCRIRENEEKQLQSSRKFKKSLISFSLISSMNKNLWGKGQEMHCSWKGRIGRKKTPRLRRGLRICSEFRNHVGRKQWNAIFKETERKTNQLRVLWPELIIFKSRGEINTFFSGKQKLQEIFQEQKNI